MRKVSYASLSRIGKQRSRGRRRGAKGRVDEGPLKNCTASHPGTAGQTLTRARIVTQVGFSDVFGRRSQVSSMEVSESRSLSIFVGFLAEAKLIFVSGSVFSSRVRQGAEAKYLRST